MSQGGYHVWNKTVEQLKAAADPLRIRLIQELVVGPRTAGGTGPSVRDGLSAGCLTILVFYFASVLLTVPVRSIRQYRARAAPFEVALISSLKQVESTDGQFEARPGR